MMYYYGLLCAALMLGGCKNETSQPSVELPPTRTVATVYRAITETGGIKCYRAADSNAPLVTQLSNGQLADLVDAAEGTLKRGNDFWLHIYPRLGHRPSCYINVRNLMPVS